MIRVLIRPRLIKTAQNLDPEIRKRLEKVMAAIASDFGNSHKHGGIGLRKIGRRSYEARIGLQWRILFVLESGALIAHDILDHDGVLVFVSH